MKRMLLPPRERARKAIALFLLLAGVIAGAISFSIATSPAGIGGISSWQSLPFKGTGLVQMNISNPSEARETDGWGEIEFDTGARRAELLAPLQGVHDYKIILDISPEPAEFIPGAISIPYTDFLWNGTLKTCLLYTSPSPRDRTRSRMPSSA